MKELRIGHLTAKVPIIQGGMGMGISLAGLASAVANEGGIGVISAVGIGLREPDCAADYLGANIRAIRKEIKLARTMTNGILGINAMVALSNYEDIVKTSIEEGIDIIFSGAGLALNLPSFLTPGSKTKLVPIVSSGRAVNVIASRWKSGFDYLPDAFVVEGPKAGGHLGFSLEQLNDPKYALENILPEVIEAVKKVEEKYNVTIPVIAAGGIYSGADINNMLKLGASGVQMGSRFVTTDECDASIEFKNSYINATAEDVRIIKSPVGMPGRAIANEFVSKIDRGEKQPIKCVHHCLRPCDYKTAPYCILNALLNAYKGNMNSGFAFAGVNAYKATKIISVKQTFADIMQEFEEAQKA